MVFTSQCNHASHWLQRREEVVVANFDASRFHLQRDDELCWRASRRWNFPSHVAATVAAGASYNYPYRDCIVDEKRAGMGNQYRTATGLVHSLTVLPLSKHLTCQNGLASIR